MAITRVRGSTWDTADNLVINRLSDLAGITREGLIFISGFVTENDGSGGWFKYESSIPRNQADGNNFLDPTGTGVGFGLWERQKFFSSPPGANRSDLHTAVANQQTFKLNFSYIPGDNEMSVYVNGTRLTPTAFTEASTNSITINVPLRKGDVVEFIRFEQPSAGRINAIDADTVNYDQTLANLIIANNVQTALDALARTVQAGIGSVGGGMLHATGVPANAFGGMDATQAWNVQQQLQWIYSKLLDHSTKTQAAHSAAKITFNNSLTPKLTIASNVQETIEALYRIIGTGDAIDIRYDAHAAPAYFQGGTNVQTYCALLTQYSTGLESELSEHKGNPSAAHAAHAISLTSSDARLASTLTVKVALEKLSSDLDSHTHGADTVTFNATNSPIGGTAQAALDNLYSLHVAHVTPPDTVVSVHAAENIEFNSTNLISSNRVQAALEELSEELSDHKNSDQDVHAAANLTFTPGQSLNSTNVQDAILEASKGKQFYRGVMDIRAPYAPPSPGPLNNQYWSVPVTGIPHPSWTGMIGNMPTTLSGRANLIYDGNLYWYVALSGLGNEILTNPAPGANQTIVTAATNDAALILRGPIGQTRELLDVQGNIKVTGSVLAKTVSDKDGNVRQSAQQVSLNDSATGVTGKNVQSAINNLGAVVNDHISGTDSYHYADHILLKKSIGLAAADVYAGLVATVKKISDHENSNTAHPSNKITFSHSLFTANNVSAALAELVSAITNQNIDGGTY